MDTKLIFGTSKKPEIKDEDPGIMRRLGIFKKGGWFCYIEVDDYSKATEYIAGRNDLEIREILEEKNEKRKKQKTTRYSK